jgi:hypothetical protein
MMAPSGTHHPDRDRLGQEVKTLLGLDGTFRSSSRVQGVEVGYLAPAEFGLFMKKRSPMEACRKSANIKIE